MAVHHGTDEAAAEETAATIAEAGGRAFTVGAEPGVPDDVDTLVAGLEAGIDATGGVNLQQPRREGCARVRGAPA